MRLKAISYGGNLRRIDAKSIPAARVSTPSSSPRLCSSPMDTDLLSTGYGSISCDYGPGFFNPALGVGYDADLDRIALGGISDMLSGGRVSIGMNAGIMRGPCFGVGVMSVSVM
ncbi:uncharacterized protein ColSpa_06988 [Colletotrichum spaethianum]|uniref:Uncharacterized protein n=1 Tax=Colletotrichum spaethianum TaxID=700344 RepID=A0AA37NZ08_9PEZI|nr:uncharacterized protein ColSpa_06988 [Colletotrichum spaethianum]GKT46807.1 hypothetical protein ColSpa_06988 [Colletotrichum spaethianum]